eukprot:TRINITY_DN451_c0_g1_i4.p1 TRINITY_DN451_c0_g1~~TRINITY_DN451_c0_g1_i4.p1  ORF type:complete len:302 (-),score=73.22 TRINITY_DN451_c0_g1_i4:835-1683(-)
MATEAVSKTVGAVAIDAQVSADKLPTMAAAVVREAAPGDAAAGGEVVQSDQGQEADSPGGPEVQSTRQAITPSCGLLAPVCLICGKREGWLLGFRGFGFRQSGHAKRCAERHGLPPPAEEADVAVGAGVSAVSDAFHTCQSRVSNAGNAMQTQADEVMEALREGKDKVSQQVREKPAELAQNLQSKKEELESKTDELVDAAKAKQEELASSAEAKKDELESKTSELTSAVEAKKNELVDAAEAKQEKLSSAVTSNMDELESKKDELVGSAEATKDKLASGFS